MAHRTKPLALAAGLLALLGACGEPQETESGLQGLWRSRGYGLVARVTPGRVRLIERTPVSCLPVGKYSVEKFRSKFKVRADPQGRTFEIHNDGTVSTITFEAFDGGGFERLCPAGLTPRTDDPELNFEVLWHTFDQHYAFFSERKVDWHAVYAEVRPRIDKETTSRELGKTLRRMLERLKDAHVSLSIDGDDVVSVRSRPSGRLRKECRARRGNRCRAHRYIRKRMASIDEVLKSSYLKKGFKTALRKNAIWGRIGPRTGYFRMDSMAGLVRRRHSSSDDLAALKPVLDQVMEDLGRLPNMIVDVRFNGGGHDAVAIAIADRFTGKRRIFGSKSAFENGRRTKRQDLILEPASGPHYRGRVAVLISGETASAAEVFALAMRSLPQVTMVGEATMGIFSDELYRSLPNGWTFSLSNEIYLNPKDELFEARGVPPDVPAPFASLEDDRRGLDSVIEAAMAALDAPRKAP